MGLKKRATPKRIIFDVSEEDHQLIKEMALKRKMPIRTFIINAIADAIRKDSLS